MDKEYIKIKKALISVYDKSGLLPFAKFLIQQNVEIISTGGTAKLLTDNGIKVTKVSDITKYPEILGGRVKTLHPIIHAGLLSRADNGEDKKTMDDLNISNIDLAIVNLYPFEETINSTTDFEKIIENIDIGGPTIIRASAKNHSRVTIATDSNSYQEISDHINKFGGTSNSLRLKLAYKAFSHTAKYDSIISNWFSKQIDSSDVDSYNLSGQLNKKLRYGENPHQTADFYSINNNSGIGQMKQIQGKELSYNNINDTDAALQLILDFKNSQPTIAIIKHANPCGVASAKNLNEAYRLALRCDPVSAFGGIIVSNKELDASTAKNIIKVFSEVIIAPSATEEAIDIVKEKKNLRLLLLNNIYNSEVDNKIIKSVFGGFLIQDRDDLIITKENLKVVTKKMPSDEEISDLIFAFKIAKHVKSNAIIYAKNQSTVGIGAGQMSRVDSSRIAAYKADYASKLLNMDKSLASGCVIASDAFFPFSDGLEAAIEVGATAVIQPGGSMRDNEVIKAADDANVSMVFTGIRHFRH
ncbi:bifunctional phosphoribosylaminoimidazolecarboxamide formyltransferase/IMP cyclohydrolase [Hyphomicrobiales bacterium]|nr:bifunctional phosphoribosylaminoimidazolecarboxamide formyltransferase/IMP cyclohydrolase [Hyphomicrobiales bacterium]